MSGFQNEIPSYAMDGGCIYGTRRVWYSNAAIAKLQAAARRLGLSAASNGPFMGKASAPGVPRNLEDLDAAPDMFRPRLDEQINMKHPLARLAGLLDWDEIHRSFAVHFSSGVVARRSPPAWLPVCRTCSTPSMLRTRPLWAPGWRTRTGSSSLDPPRATAPKVNKALLRWTRLAACGH